MVVAWHRTQSYALPCNSEATEYGIWLRVSHEYEKNLGPVYLHGLNLTPAWISNYTHHNVLGEIMY